MRPEKEKKLRNEEGKVTRLKKRKKKQEAALEKNARSSIRVGDGYRQPNFE